MTTLHALRRQHALPFSELARLTGVPARRLAAFEYQEQPLSPKERERVAAFFGVPSTRLRHGTCNDLPETLRTINPPPIAATLAVAVTIALSLRLHAPGAASSASSAPPALQRSIAAASIVPRNYTSTPSRPAVDKPTRYDSGAVSSQRPRGANTRDEARQTARDASVTPSTFPPDDSVAALELRSFTFAFVTEQTDQPVMAVAEPTPEAADLPTPSSESLSVRRMGTGVKQMQVAAGSASGASRTTTFGVPDRCPLAPRSGRVIITQGYDVGTHAPAHIWGGLDLAASSGPTAGAPVIATHAGYARVVLESWPGGNYVSITGAAGWRTAYAHLGEVYVATGQFIEAGTVIGTAGNTGNSTGPHLHYETWRDGVNVNPAPVLNCN